jgi:hypothetical protein
LAGALAAIVAAPERDARRGIRTSSRCDFR